MSKRKSPAASSRITDAEVEERINEFFEQNYALLRQEGGHVLAEGARKQALTQALLYWRKLKSIASSVTQTEVKLALPGQVTPSGRPFVIEGVVDIVREGDEVWMYDLKTHEASEVRAEREQYMEQLNVYAHIWKGIQNQTLDGTAIIATRLPLELRDAIQSGDRRAIKARLSEWEPVVELPFDEKKIRQTVENFGRCVDAIEDGKFAPPAPEELGRSKGSRRPKRTEPTFAQIHCRNCDARFSCASHRAYLASRSSEQGQDERELDAWIDENLGEA